MNDCPAGSAAVEEQGGTCPLCGEPASEHRSVDDPMAAMFEATDGEDG